MEVILSRDPKSLYKKFKMKEINNVVGLDIIPDIPKDPTVLIKYDKDRKLETFLHDIIDA